MNKIPCLRKSLFVVTIISGFLVVSFILESCSGCSKSGINNLKNKNNINSPDPALNAVLNNKNNVVKMVPVNGVYMVPVEINGVMMEFIFDTGASDITISATEAIFLYKQGKLSDMDIKGVREYEIADGTIAEGTVINLKRVRIGNKTLENVEASVMHNLSSPLLMGQSALSRFGRITVDYNRNEIRFD